MKFLIKDNFTNSLNTNSSNFSEVNPLSLKTKLNLSFNNKNYKDLLANTSQFINYINDHDILNFNSINEINIFFTNENVQEMYSSDNKEIYISKNFLTKEPKQSFDNFVDYLVSNVDFETATQIVVSHEMAHSFQDQLYELNKTHILERSNNFNDHLFNSITSLRNYHSSDEHIFDFAKNLNFNLNVTEEEILNTHKAYDVNFLISQSVEEGFSDLYSCLCVYDLQGKDKAIEVAQIISEGRKQFSPEYPSYYTLNTFIDDLNNSPESLNFKNFNDMNSYMSKTISNSTDLFLNNVLSGNFNEFNRNSETQKIYNAKFLGSINSLVDKDILKNPNKSDLENPKNVLNFINKTQENFEFSQDKYFNFYFEKSKNIYGDFLDGKPQQSYLESQSSINDYSKKSKFKKNLISDSLNGNSINENIKHNNHENNDFTITSKTRKKDGLGY